MSIDHEMEEILQLFFEESFEGLDTMESGLLSLDNSADRETINTIFRAAHSIKGGAGTFGFMEISGFTHSVETLLVDTAGRTMQEIVEAVKRVNDIMGEITTASADQSSSIESVNASIAGMDRSTQQNASMVEEAAAAATRLRQQVERLHQAASIFELADEDALVAEEAPAAERRGPNRARNVVRMPPAA